MNKPILFVDEKPFWGSDTKAQQSYHSLKDRLETLGGINEVEFFFEKNDEFPFNFKSQNFTDTVANRKFIFIHNSYPQSQERTLFPLQVVNEMKKLLEGKCKVVRFSGQMYRRGYDSEQEIEKIGKEKLKVDQPLIEKDLMVERDDIYLNFDMFVRHLINGGCQPNFFILKYGINALKGNAQEIEAKMFNACFEEYKDVNNSLISTVNRLREETIKQRDDIKKRLKPNWKNLIEHSTLEICEIAGFNQERKEKAINYLNSEKVTHSKYFAVIKKVIDIEIKILKR